MRRERIEKAIVTLEIEDGHAKRSWVQRQDGDVATAAAVFDAGEHLLASTAADG
jgi:hypothetical protein